jgi:hypothetical protein
MPYEQRAKISATLHGRKQSETTKQRISVAMKNYWATIPSENNEEKKQNGNGTENQI